MSLPRYLLSALVLALPLSTSANAATPPSAQPANQAPSSSRLALQKSIERMPVSFFPLAQPGGATSYVARGAGFSLDVAASSLTLETEHKLPAAPTQQAASAGMMTYSRAADVERLRTRIDFLGASASATLVGLDPASSRVNYLIGKDPAKWQRDLPTYGRIRANGLYPGIDLVYYGNNRGGRPGALEYDLVVSPHADPAQVRLRVSGDRRAVLDAAGNLCLDGLGGSMRLARPVLYQSGDTGRQPIDGKFVEVAENEFAFHVAAYDHAKPLIVDPQINLLYATYAGGIHNDEAYDMALDASGAAYITGWSASQDFPVTGNAIQTVRKTIGSYLYDMVALKLDSSGNLVYSTYLGGTYNDQGDSIVVNPDGSVYIAGFTQSADFPVTANAFQPNYGGGSDGFLVKISSDGSQLLYSTYLGGTGDESIGKLLLNADGSLWMSGGASAAGLPTSTGAFQSKPNGTDNYFVAKAVFDGSGNMTLPALTYIGGSNTSEENGYADLATDAAGNLYLGGGTNSGDYPVTANAYEKPFPTSGGCYNSSVPNSIGTLTKFSPDLTKALYSTVIGGHTEDQQGYPVCNQFVRTVHVDPSTGNIWLVGTVGMSDFPTTANAISKQLNGNGYAGVDDFVAELSADGSTLLYGTYLGGSQFDYGSRAAWDANNNIWIVGTTQSTDYPVTSDALQPTIGGGYDTTLTELSPDGSRIVYATYLGGSGDDDYYGHPQVRIDAQGSVRLTGDTGSTNYPVTASAFQPLFANGDSGADTYDVYYAVLGSGTIGAISTTVGGNTGDTTVTIGGAGLVQGATCSLIEGKTTIQATSAIVNAAGTSITCTFPLSGAVAGTYDISVTNGSGGATYTKAGAFTVQSGGAPQLWANVVGRPEIRTGTNSEFVINVGNSGTVDAILPKIWLHLPANSTFTFPGGLASTNTNEPGDFSQDANFHGTDGSEYVPFFLGKISAGQTVVLPIVLNSTMNQTLFEVDAYTSLPFFATSEAASAEVQQYLANTASIPSACAAANAFAQDCLGFEATDYANLIAGSDGGTIANGVKTSYGITLTQADGFSYFLTAIQNLLTNKGSVTGDVRFLQMPNNRAPHALRPDASGTPVNANPFQGFFGGVGFYNQRRKSDDGKMDVNCSPIGPSYDCTANPGAGCPLGDKCQNYNCTDGSNYTSYITGGGSSAACSTPPKFCPAQKAPGSLARRATYTPFSIPRSNSAGSGGGSGTGTGGGDGDSCGGSGGSVDPNYKTGRPGDGSASEYIQNLPLTYSVGFENEATATLPAAAVVVTDQLDPTKVDLSTLTLSSIGFGTNLITLPSGLTSYQTNYAPPGVTAYTVRIQGSVNTTTGLLKYTFQTIDPTTGQPPTDPTIGFLPPDVDGIEGQGAVTFSVRPLATDTTNTAIPNQATVVFDTNAPIMTPTWLNTIDVDPPASTVGILPASQASTTIPVTWSGTDKGSGIAFYSIYVSDNGGPYTVFQNQVTATGATYTGTLGHTYGFYSIATDNVGNVEAAKSKADTTIGIGVTPDFSIAATSASISVAPGSSGSAMISITPVGGFAGAVTFACSGLPSEATCSFSPATVTPSGGAAATTLTIATTAASTSAAVARAGWSTVAALFSGLLLMLRVRRFRLQTAMRVMVALLALGVAGWSAIGCGGGSSKSTTSNPGTPAGTSTVTVTASSGALSHSTTVTLVVQ